MESDKRIKPQDLMVNTHIKDEAFRLRALNFSYERIGEKLGLSKMAVLKSLRKTARKYYERHLEDVDRIKAEQVAQLCNIIDEAYQAWQKSKESSKSIRQKRISNSVVEEIHEGHEQYGDPRLLEVIRRGLEDIRKIIGADAPPPKESRFSGASSESIPVTLNARIDRVVSLYEEAKASINNSRIGSDNKGTEGVETTTWTTE